MPADAPPAPLPSAPFPPGDRSGAIVLVHGAWVGAWCWAPLRSHLADSGRAVHTVSLTGHGDRAHQSGPHVTLADHVADVAGVITSNDLSDVVLVGHSYGGRVITQVWGRLHDRIGRLVYLDAHAPVLGDVPFDPRGLPAADQGMIPFAGYEPDLAEFGSEEAIDWFTTRTMPQAAGTLQASFHLDLPDELDKTYVFATGNPESRFRPYAIAASADPSWRYVEVDGSHWVMVSHPERIASVILDTPDRPAHPDPATERTDR